MTSTENYQNPYHRLTPDLNASASVQSTLQQAVEHDVGQLVSLELTAESMFQEEAALLGAYMREDLAEAQSFWGELKSDIHTWEMNAGDLLLSVADPTRTEWHRTGWWQSGDDEFHGKASEDYWQDGQGRTKTDELPPFVPDK